MGILNKIRKWREKKKIQKWEKIKNWVEFGVSEKPKPKCYGNYKGLDKDFETKPENEKQCHVFNCHLSFDCQRATIERMIKEGKAKGYIVWHGPKGSRKIENK
jgi:Tat protein secretion system quality control protein TatD with DNase activity